MTTGKRDAIRAQRTKKKRQQRLNTLLWIGGIILFLVLLMASPAIYNAVKPAGAFVEITPQAYPMAEGKGFGNPNAPVKIEVYEDFQCPSCANYSETTEYQLVNSTYVTDGQVYYEFMHYPFIDTNSVTKESHQAANASMCALEQGRFWDYHDMIYANQGTVENGGALNDKRLEAFAESLGLDMTAFSQCFSEDKYSEEIDADFQKGQSLGVTGTPTVFVNGLILSPKYVPTYEQLQAAIESALAASDS
jgi:protein-disulfide isomerase